MNYTREHVREHAYIVIPITESTDGESLTVMVSNIISQLDLGLKLVGITSDGGTNLVRFKDILGSTFEKTGVFDLGKPMFVMERLSHVLYNACKTGIIYVQSDDGRVDT